MKNRSGSSIPPLSYADAEIILQEVFAACGKAPTAVPLEVLSSYTEYRRDRFTLQKTVLILILIVFLLLPVGFLSPGVEAVRTELSQIGAPTYTIKADSLLPVRTVTAQLDGQAIAVYQLASGLFSVTPRSNGLLTVTVTLVNGQYRSWSTQIDTVDTKAPELLQIRTVGDLVRLYVSDDGVGMDYEGAYALTPGGDRLLPSEIDETRGYLAFPKSAGLHLFLPDKNGNQLQLVLTDK